MPTETDARQYKLTSDATSCHTEAGSDVLVMRAVVCKLMVCITRQTTAFFLNQSLKEND